MLVDLYDHPDNGLLYISENIPGPQEETEEYKQIWDNFNSQIAVSCVCHECGRTCDCVGQRGTPNYILRSDGLQVLNIEKCASQPVFECNSNCGNCSDNCINRLVQKGPATNLFIDKCNGDATSNKGYGLFTHKILPRGSFICEYAGEVITEQQALIRQRTAEENGLMNFIFCLKEHGANNVLKTFVDPSCIGNIGRYINHSCQPNCFIIPVRVDVVVPKLAVFSNTDICAGAEITFDYGPVNSVDSLCKGKRKRCYCRSELCRQWLPAYVF